MTVQELTQILASMHQSNKTDDDVATRLKQVQLGEELTAADRATLEQYLPGPESKEQLDILAGLSAFLPPAGLFLHPLPPYRTPAPPSPALNSG